ncbi:protoporphyrinogen/coproporphyrinogen oxidase [Micromonospora sp. WMMD730]|uniref:protoporphyrinogen/coproporphyrinogen oxidase n=1 Tax=Micromonospora sp. WMMD730 TaxID=3404128 RepID=UPI003B946AEA
MRIVVVGGGLAGLTTAWLLEHDHETILLEAQAELGGHVRSATTLHHGVECAVDLGAQDFSAALFPRHARLIQLMGLAAEVVEVPTTVTIQVPDMPVPLLVTPDGTRSGILGAAGEALALLTRAAVDWDTEGVSWERSYADLVEPIPVSDGLKRTVLYAPVAALYGCSVDDARQVSGRAATAVLARSAAPAVGGSVGWQNLVGGLARLVRAIAVDLLATTIRTGSEITRMESGDRRWTLSTAGGQVYQADQVVLAVPPPRCLRLIRQFPHADRLSSALAGFRYLPSTTGLHLDPAYLPARADQWSTSNLTVYREHADSTAWYGPITGARVFRSQLTHRPRLPERLVATADFEQLYPDAVAVRGRRVLADHQGRDGIWFAGHHLADIDSQETAVNSAIDIAARLAPASHRLRMLTEEVGLDQQRGRQA